MSLFRLSRIEQNTDILLPALVFVLLVYYFWIRCRRDAADLSRMQRGFLLTLRLLTLAAVFVFYVHPQWFHLTGSSKVAVLVDTSASMSINDAEKNTRINAVRQFIAENRFVAELEKKHTTDVFSFDSGLFDGSALAENKPGEATAIGDALTGVLQREREQPLAAVIVFSDGQQNTGQPTDAALAQAKLLRVPIYTAGLGVLTEPLAVRIGSIDVPPRVYPNDPFKLNIPIRVEGTFDDTQQQNVTVQIFDGTTKMDEKNVDLKSASIPFDVKLAAAGKHTLQVKLNVPQTPSLNSQHELELTVVDRKDRVLLYASAPTRDYQFICAQIYRDKTMTADVLPTWLGDENIAQNADKILTAFPKTAEEMSQYDTIIAFDPDWRKLSPEMLNVLDQWVSRAGGGLIIVAGGIYQGDVIAGWAGDKGFEKVQAMYPVEFYSHESALDHKMYTGAKPMPLHFTPAGESADFLRPFADAAQSRGFWNHFAGFYAYFAVKGVKPAATALVMLNEGKCPLIAEQFYGSGRVVYIGSGELWRLRKEDSKVFEQIVTKMVRYVCQGRLQRDSDRGTIVTDKQTYSLGAAAQIRITDNLEQALPMTLPVDVLTPSGKMQLSEAKLDPNVPGVYQAFVPLGAEGNWTFQVKLGEHQIKSTVSVRLSDLESEHTNRNEPLLKTLAAETGGEYFPTFDGLTALAERIPVRSQKAVLDTAAEAKLYWYLLTAVCTLLLLEWSLRRFWKLA